MDYRVIVTPIADAEAMGSFRWYSERSYSIAERWHAGLSKAITSLAKKPARFPVSREDSGALGCEVRTLLYGRRRGVIRILYTISGETVWVLRIRHSAQGPIIPEAEWRFRRAHPGHPGFAVARIRGPVASRSTVPPSRPPMPKGQG